MRFLIGWVLAFALVVSGCGDGGVGGAGGVAGDGGDGGAAGMGGMAGMAGVGGVGGTGGSGEFAITPGHWSSWLLRTSICLFVNEDGTKLVADPSCNQTENPLFPFAFQVLANPDGDICGFGYPMEGEEPQEVPIVDNKFEIEQTRGDVTIKFSGEFGDSNSVGGVASSTMNCPEDVPWTASPGCCSRCSWCQ